MPRKSVYFGLLVMVLMPLPALALGLGEITLNSYLNEPLDADIELVSVEPSDLEKFEAGIASLDTFTRYGLDRPDFLSNLRFRIVRGSGRPLLKVTSTTSITEPFVTFLVEANWTRGRLLREYTVLLDPPVFSPDSSAPPVATARTAPSQVSPDTGFVPRPQPPQPAPAPRRPTAAAIGGESYGPVRRNETLWVIADSARQGSDLTINQMMIAIYRANPEAFLGNINLLKEGSTLRLPGATEASDVSRQDALQTARAHHESWRAGGKLARTPSAARPAPGTAAADDGTRRLRLVAPDSASASDDVAISELREDLVDEQARNAELSDDIDALRRELEDTKRLFELKSADLAEMQARLAEAADRPSDASTSGAAAVDSGAPTEASPDTTPPDAGSAQGSETTVAGTTTDATGATPADAGSEAPVAADAQPATGAEPATVAQTQTPAPAAPASPSIADRVLGFFGQFWIWILGALALLGALFVALRSQRGDEAESWEALSRESGAPSAVSDAGEAAADTAASQEVEYFEDTGTFKPVDFSDADAATGEVRVQESGSVDFPFEDTMSGDDAMRLDQSDPLAEADFHMAYGLYDQAADLVRTASEREPARRDLKMKLLEIYFVWGNKDAFLASATALHSEIGDQPDGDWDKILIMGKQICPDEALFSGGMAGGGAGAVDLQLDETMGAPLDLLTDDSASGDGVDLDLGGALDAAASSAAAPDNVIDFDFSTDTPDPAAEAKEKIRAATEDAEDTEEMDLSEIGIDLDFGETGSFDSVDTLAGADADATGTENIPTGLEDDAAEDFDELFAGIDDLPEVAADDVRDAPQAAPVEGEKLLDTSELKVEMEELLASTGMTDMADDGTERGLQSMSDDQVPETIAGQSDKTGSFSAEIRSLSDDAFDINLDDGPAAEDDDATALMEQPLIEDSAADNTQEFDAAFGSDDETVMAETLIGPDIDPAAADFDIVFDDDDDATALMEAVDEQTAGDETGKTETHDFSAVFGTDEHADTGATQEFASVFDAGADADAAPKAAEDFAAVFENDDSAATGAVEAASSDEIAFQGVFDEGADSAANVDEMSSDIFATQETPGVDLDVGESLEEAGDGTTIKVAAADLALPEVAQAGADEVGTKLDLARAYMEMGDPDGARGILQEVMEEGNDNQKQDARALLDALP